MLYDLQIIESKTGEADYTVPGSSVYGISKLIQRVVLLLLSDDGELINYTGGGANSTELSAGLLLREAARVSNVLTSNKPDKSDLASELHSLSIKVVTQDVSLSSIGLGVVIVSVEDKNSGNNNGITVNI